VPRGHGAGHGEGNKNCSGLDEDAVVNIYVAAMVMRDLGLDSQGIRAVLIKLFHHDPGGELERWLQGESRPAFTPRTFEKALWYHEAYRLAIEIRRRHPGWSYRKIASEVGKRLPIYVPPLTVYFWVTGRSRPNVTPLKLTRETLPAVAYCVGVLCGDYRRAGGGLKARDREFVENFARMYEIATGVKPKVRKRKDGYWETREGGGWLRSCWEIGLWKLFAELDPINWLRGLFDSEGCVSPLCDHKRRILYSIMILLTTGNREVKEMAKKKLEELGFGVRELYREKRRAEVRGKVYEFDECWKLIIEGWQQAKRIAELINFTVSHRRQKLQDLLKLRHLPLRMRYEIWTQWYKKVNGRWVKV